MPKVTDLTESLTIADSDFLYAVVSGNSRKIRKDTLIPLATPVSTIKPQTAIAASGQAEMAWTSIPSWVRRITVMMQGLSLSGTDNLLVQLGNIGGYVATGYVSGSESAAGTGQGTVSSTAGLIVFAGLATRAQHGDMTLTFSSAGVWVAKHDFSSGGADLASGGGSVTGAGTVDRIRIIATGANTFDAGSANIAWE